MTASTKTDFHFPGQQKVYHGKVRDVYTIDDKLVMVATDRISAFDVIMPKGIPYKGHLYAILIRHCWRKSDANSLKPILPRLQTAASRWSRIPGIFFQSM